MSLEINPRNELLKLYRGEDTKTIPTCRYVDVAFAPGERPALPSIPGSQGLDWFGVNWECCPDLSWAPTLEKPRLNDVTKWKEEGVVPTAEAIDALDWDAWAAMWEEKFDRKNHLQEVWITSGFFERLHNLMGFEDSLCAYYTDPDAVHEFMDAMLVYKKHLFRKIKEYLNPDAIFQMDDFGHNKNTFLSREMWKEFIELRLGKLIDYTHELGLFYNLHSCGNIMTILADIVALGPDAVNPAQAVNDLVEYKRIVGNKALIIDELNRQIVDSAYSLDADVEREIRKGVRTLAAGGHYLPQIFDFGMEGAKDVNATPEEARAKLVIDATAEELKSLGYELIR
ncbi:MAG: hypothetical protein LBN36_05340 [Clostridiales Family XIII bacterium]|nr:hypothetical protein [Clostridiales Family XIII bacterium]